MTVTIMEQTIVYTHGIVDFILSNKLDRRSFTNIEANSRDKIKQINIDF